MTRQYQTGKFVLLKQCYYCANMGAFFNRRKWCFIPPPNTIRVKYYWFLGPGEEAREAVRPARPEEEHDGQGSQFRAPPL